MYGYPRIGCEKGREIRKITTHICDPGKSLQQGLYTVISLVIHSQTSYPQSPGSFQIFAIL